MMPTSQLKGLPKATVSQKSAYIFGISELLQKACERYDYSMSTTYSTNQVRQAAVQSVYYV